MKLLFTLILLSASTGCTTIAKYQDSGDKELARLILKYCATVDESYRLQRREAINNHLNGLADIKINCALEIN